MSNFGKTESFTIKPGDDIENEMNQYNVKMSASAIPDLDSMLFTIQEMLEFIESDEMSNLENSFLDDFTLANDLEDSIKKLDEGDPTENQKILETKRQIAKLRKIAKKKKDRFETNVYSKYNSILPMKIISLLIEQERDDNLNELLDMFDKLKAVKKGDADIEQEADKFGEKLRGKYVYNHFGGKEGYEKMLRNSRK